MSDFAVSATIKAVDKISSIFAHASQAVGKFGSTAEGAFDHASKKESKFIEGFKAHFAALSADRIIERLFSTVKDQFKEGLEYASDLVEVQNVIDTTFGKESAKTVYQWAKTASDAFGESELQALRFAGTMGAMLKSSGLAGSKIQQMSTGLSGLAGDIASFYNLGIDEAFDKIRSGISGETEPLKQLGINMSVANLQAYALTQGIHKQWQKLSQAEQVQLRYGYLMKASADAQGDFSKTLETSYANQKRVLQNNFQSVVGNTMQAVLPVALKLTSALNGIVKKAGEWVSKNKELIATGVQKFIDGVVSVGKRLEPVLAFAMKAIGWLASHIDVLIAGYIAWKAAQIAINIAMDANPIGIVIAAIQILVGIIIFAVEHWKEITEWTDRAWKSVKEFATGVFNTVIPYLQAFGQTLLKFGLMPINLIIEGVKGLLSVLAKLPGKVGDPFRSALQSITDFQDKANQTLTGSKGAFDFGGTWANATAPNENAPRVNVNNNVYVDNSRAPGTSTVIRQAQRVSGQQGYQYSGGLQ